MMFLRRNAFNKKQDMYQEQNIHVMNAPLFKLYMKGDVGDGAGASEGNPVR